MMRWPMPPVVVTFGTHSPLVSGPPSTPSSPAVMLSPKLTNRVTVSFGTGAAVTVTGNEQLAVRCNASVAVHETVVAPTVKTDPDWGVQLDVTGGFPLAVVGFGNVTAIDVPVV